MVNTNSPAFKISEKVGTVLGRGIRYIVVGTAIAFFGNKMKGNPPIPAPLPPK